MGHDDKRHDEASPTDDDRLFAEAMTELGLARGDSNRSDEDDFAALLAESSGTGPPTAGSAGPRATPHTEAPPAPPDAADDAMFEAAMAELGMPPAPDGVGDAPRRSPLGVSKRRLSRRIKVGTIRSDARLDLHGKSRDEAFILVRTFLRASREDGLAVVLIIPGRGLHSRGEAVLKDALLLWLRRDFEELVHEVVKAPRERGGEGAYYVFLRRKA